MKRLLKKVQTLIQVFFWYFRLSRNRKKQRSHFLRWQHNQLLFHIKQVQRKSPYYSQFGEIHHLEQIPVINKTDYFRQFDEINTARFRKADLLEFAKQAERERNFSPKYKGHTVGLSSGTSGSQGLFVVSPDELSRYMISIVDKTIGWSILRPQRIAFFLRANSNLYSQAGNLLFHRFHFFDLIKSLNEQLTSLEKLNPSILFAPPFILYQIALAVQKKQVSIKPHVIFSVADKLEDFHQKQIENIFGLKVRQVYQATEGFLGISCDYGTIHLNEDFIFFEKEMIDEKSFFPIITDLFRTTQPMIRYRLDDVLTMSSEPCSCGSHLQALASIQGRQDDIVIGMTLDEKQVPLLPDFLRRAALLVTEEFHDYQIKQVNLKLFELSTFPENRDLQKGIQKNIEDFFRSQRLQVPQIDFVPYEAPHAMSKRRRITRSSDLSWKNSHPI